MHDKKEFYYLFFILAYPNGGLFMNMPLEMYMGGRVNHFDNCDPSRMSMPEIVSMVETLGYSGFINYYFRLPGRNLDNGLHLMKSDKDVMDMLEQIPNSRVIQVYLDHVGI